MVNTTTTKGTIVTGTGGSDEDVRVTVATFLRSDSPLVVRYRARLNHTVGFETAMVNNTANMTYLSHPSTVHAGGRRRGSLDGATVGVESLPTLLMNLSATSNPETGTARLNPGVEDLTVGETVTFTVGVELMEGTSNVRLQVDLPTQVGGGRLEVFSTRVVQVGSRIRYSPLSAGDAATSVANIGGGDNVGAGNQEDGVGEVDEGVDDEEEGDEDEDEDEN